MSRILLASPTLPKSTIDTVVAILDYVHKRSGISSLEKWLGRNTYL